MKKNQAELPKEKLTFFNTNTKKNEDFTFYDYVGHLEKFGYEWNKEGFKYEIKIKNKKIIKKLTLEKQQRIDFNVDASRIFNTQRNGSSGIISFLMGYLENTNLLKKYFKISGKIFDFTSLPILKKHTWMGEYSIAQNHRSAPHHRGLDDLYSIYFRPFTIILKDPNFKIKKFNDRIQKLFAPRFYHDRRQTNFLKDMRFVGGHLKINEPQFCRFKSIGRRLYEYRPTTQKIKEFIPQEIDIPFPEKYMEDFTYTVSGFSFKVNGTNKIKENLNPSSNLINFETNTESEQNTISGEIFYPVVKYLKEKIAEYDAIPTKNFINESYFLYHKSNLIKKPFFYSY